MVRFGRLLSCILSVLAFENRRVSLESTSKVVTSSSSSRAKSRPARRGSLGSTAGVLCAISMLLKRLHLASASFVAPADACWFGDDLTVELPAELPPAPPPEIVSHFDVTPQNVVFRAGEPVALIDFDLTRPGTRLQDVINTAMWWVPLFPPEDRDPAMAGGDVPSRLAMFVESYGLGAPERNAFVDRAVEGATGTWYRMRANAEHRGGGWARMWARSW